MSAAAGVRKKRNFKGLGLAAASLAPPPAEPEPHPIIGSTLQATRVAPIPGSNTAEANGGANADGAASNAPAAAPPTGGKKKRPGPLALGAKSVGGSAAAESQSKANGKTILDESGMLTIPAASGSAPATATMGSASPFRWVFVSLDSVMEV